MKQYRITASDISSNSDDDCHMAPEDPIHELKAAHALGGLGGQERLMSYRQQQVSMNLGSNKGQIQREQNIKPGTHAWFQLWFGKNNK